MATATITVAASFHVAIITATAFLNHPQQQPVMA